MFERTTNSHRNTNRKRWEQSSVLYLTEIYCHNEHLLCSYISLPERKRRQHTVRQLPVSRTVCVCVMWYYLGLSSVRVYLICRCVAVMFQGSCNLAELTKTRQEVKHLGCQLVGNRAVLFRGGWAGTTLCLLEGITVAAKDPQHKVESC